MLTDTYSNPVVEAPGGQWSPPPAAEAQCPLRRDSGHCFDQPCVSKRVSVGAEGGRVAHYRMDAERFNICQRAWSATLVQDTTPGFCSSVPVVWSLVHERMPYASLAGYNRRVRHGIFELRGAWLIRAGYGCNYQAMLFI